MDGQPAERFQNRTSETAKSMTPCKSQAGGGMTELTEVSRLRFSRNHFPLQATDTLCCGGWPHVSRLPSHDNGAGATYNFITCYLCHIRATGARKKKIELLLHAKSLHPPQLVYCLLNLLEPRSGAKYCQDSFGGFVWQCRFPSDDPCAASRCSCHVWILPRAFQSGFRYVVICCASRSLRV